MKRFDIINALIKKNRYKSYLEIGTSNKGENFNKINCSEKYCVDIDPLAQADFTGSSDDFFEQNEKQYDIFFVDGLHEYKQVMIDICNAWASLNLSGTIVVHDCNPEKEIIQRVPRETLEWTGSVWKAIVELRQEPLLTIHTVDTDYGCAIIQVKDNQNPLLEEIQKQDLTYANLEKNRKEWLGLISVEQFKQMYL